MAEDSRGESGVIEGHRLIPYGTLSSSPLACCRRRSAVLTLTDPAAASCPELPNCQGSPPGTYPHPRHDCFTNRRIHPASSPPTRTHASSNPSFASRPSQRIQHAQHKLSSPHSYYPRPPLFGARPRQHGARRYACPVHARCHFSSSPGTPGSRAEHPETRRAGGRCCVSRCRGHETRRARARGRRPRAHEAQARRRVRGQRGLPGQCGALGERGGKGGSGVAGESAAPSTYVLVCCPERTLYV